MWKKYGGRCSTVKRTKRIYPRQGLLGYKVLIDGYNNTFEMPVERDQPVRLRSDPGGVNAGFGPEEREKIIEMDQLMRQYVLDDDRRTKQTISARYQRWRRPDLSSSRKSQRFNEQPVVETRPALHSSVASTVLNKDSSRMKQKASSRSAMKSRTPAVGQFVFEYLSHELSNESSI